jgi:FkbM family methyltransferase
MMISYAQNFEDVILWRVLKDVSNGLYVDVGAFHPEIDSVTKWFYDQGWTGINLEPVPEMLAILEAARPRDTNICAAAGATAGTAQMAVIPESMGLSSFDVAFVEAHIDMSHALVQVEVRPLREVLEPFVGKDIHFLKIDVEGSEWDVLRGMDFVRFRPWVVVVEATEPLSQTRTVDKWDDILSTNHYQHVYFDGLNDFFVAAEKMELASRLGRPPNVFDQFEMAATVRERQARDELHRSYQDLAAVCESLRAEASRRDDELTTVRQELAAARESHAVLKTKFEAAENELAAFREQLPALQAELSRRVGELAVATDELVAARQAHAVLQRKFEAAEKRIAGLRDQLGASEAAVVKLSEDLSELAQALRSDRETYAASQRQLQQVLNSRSFRWLSPARRLRALFRPPQQ